MDDTYDGRPIHPAADLALVGSVAVVLVAVHYLVPPPLQAAYVLDPSSPTPVTLFTAAFLHVSDAHLVGNVVGYALGALSAHLLALRVGERRWFRRSTVVLVLGLPIPLNWTSLRVLELYFGDVSAPIRGFSGVAAAFGGFAFAALLAYVGRRTDRRTALFAGVAVVLVLLWEVLVIYAGHIPTVSTGAVALGVGLCGLEIGRWRFRDGSPETRADWRRIGKMVLVFAWTLLVLAVLIAGLFPAEVAAEDGFTNVFAHAIGLGYGVVVSGWGYRYWCDRSA